MGSAAGLSYRQQPDCRDLGHIPGVTGYPYFGVSLNALFGWEPLALDLHRRFGNLCRVKMITQHGIMLQGADNLQRIFLDREQNFSTEMGYEMSLGQFYRGGLLLRDFDDHKFQRRIMQGAFKTAVMKRYVEQMNPIMARHIAGWSGQTVEFFPAIKKCLLEVGAKVFIGIDQPGPEMERVNEAFLDIGEGLLGQVRVDIPGTRYARGKRGERYLARYFREQIPLRRAATDKHDMFSFLCQERDDEGNYYSDADIIAHAAFLLFAAHDTTTSVLCHVMMYTSQDRSWQERMRAESRALGKPFLDYEDLEGMEMMDRVFHEVLRLRPSVPMMTRRSIRECEIEGYRIPANTMIFLPMIWHHRDPQFWTDPERFDPDRFSPERAEHKRHSFCYTPFGGGAHKCIGLHFAGMLTKTFMHQLLLKYDYRLPPGFEPKAEWFPMPKPRKLPVIFTPLA